MSNNININKNIILSNKESTENAEKNNFEKEIENHSTKEKEFTKISNNNTKKDPIYIMTLELEKGKPEKINIYSDSDPKQIASDFCKEHNLDYNGLDYLKKRIESLLNQKSLEQKEKMAQSQKNENININKENNQYYEINNNSKDKNQNNDIKNYNNYNLNSPKENTNSKNKIGTENNYNFNKSSSKKPGHKCKARIQNNEDSDKKFDKIYQEMKYKSYIQNENNNFLGNKNKIKNYNEYIDDRKKQLKLEKEKELFELQRKINKKNNIKLYNNESKTNSSIKNYRKKNYFNNNYNNNNCNYKYNTKKVDNKITKILKEYEEKYSFHPSINDNFKTDLTFEERQNIYNNIYKKRKEELRNFYLNSKKDENGDFLFKPRLISKPKYKYNDEEKKIKCDIFHKNYLFWKKYNLDKEQLYKKYYSNNKYEPIIFTKKQNEKIINETKSRAFNNLFKDLDGDQDNIINGINISIYKIPNNIYKIIEPLLNELKEDNQSLNREEFIKAMNKLYEDLSSLERRTIINTYSKKLKQNKSYNIYDSFLNKNNTNNIRTSTQNSYINEKTIPNTNPNTNKLAFKHYKKISRMLDNIYESNKKNKKFCNINLNKSKNENIKENKYFGTDTNKIDKLDKIDDNFTYICNCTFNNYIKKLN
jgi:hypothetical protein